LKKHKEFLAQQKREELIKVSNTYDHAMKEIETLTKQEEQNCKSRI